MTTTKKDHWENQEELTDFMAKQVARLGYPQLQEMEQMTEPRVSDTVISAAMRGQIDPKRAKRKTLDGLASLANAKGAPVSKHRCPTCGNWYYEVVKK